jgi:hypothetical protein
MRGEAEGAGATGREAAGADAAQAGERWKLALGWLVVGLPAAWGVAQVLLKSMALFR